MGTWTPHNLPFWGLLIVLFFFYIFALKKVGCLGLK